MYPDVAAIAEVYGKGNVAVVHFDINCPSNNKEKHPLSQTEIQVDAFEMAGIAPRFDHCAGCAVEIALGDDCQAGIGCDVTARLFQRQAGNVTENTVQNASMGYAGNSSAESPG
jgi:hypothetical protein